MGEEIEGERSDRKRKIVREGERIRHSISYFDLYSHLSLLFH